MNQIIYLFLILILAIGFPLFFNLSKSLKMMENFSNLGMAQGAYPSSLTDVLVQDTYPITGINSVSDRSGSNMWKKYPIFEVGSYDQITNNLRYNENPDIGTCTAADFCFALYDDKYLGSNYVTPLPPVEIMEQGSRVNYFNTDKNLLPFRTDTANILY